MRWIRCFASKGSTVIDVGANVGLLSLYMAKTVGGNGTVVSFEPSPANLALLRYHVRVNRLRHVRIVNKAVANEHGQRVSFFLLNDGDDPSNSLTFGKDHIPNLNADAHRACREVTVETVSIDGVCAEEGLTPGLIKIDVEGAELLVLQGAVNTLSSVRPTLILAIHPWWLPEGQTPEDIVGLLLKYGYSICDRFGQATTRLEYGEYLCEPARR